MQALLKDLSYAVRKLIDRPSFAVVVVITLALSIGANTAIFSVVDAVLLRPLPYRDANRIVKIFESRPEKQQARLMVSLSDFSQWQAQSQSFEEMVALGNVRFRVAGPTPEEVAARRVSTNFFAFLGVSPALGRTFLPDDANSANDVAVVTHAYWHSRFGADPDVINKTIVLNGKPHLLIGVLPESFRQTFGGFPGSSEIWTPAIKSNEDGTRTGPGGYEVLGRLRPDVTIEQAQAEMTAVADRLAQTFSKTNTGVGAKVYSLHEEVTNATRPSLVVLFVAVGFVLLIACANIASLLLARGVERSKEVAVRLAIGAGRGRVIRQLLTESFVLSLLGGVFGWVFATWILRAIVPLIPTNLPRANEITLDYRSLVFTFGISLLATLLFGLSPAIHTAGISLTEALKSPGRISERLRSRRSRRGLIVVQLVLTTVLLVGAGLLTNSLVRLYRVDPGFDTSNLLTAKLSQRRTHGEVPQQWNTFWTSLLETSARLPGTKAAALVSPLPLGGSNYTMKVGVGSAEEVIVNYNTISLNYFQVLGIRLLQGREFTFDDKPTSAPVIVVNETLAQTYFSNEQVVGKPFFLNRGLEDEKAATIVGVVADSRVRLDEKVEPQFYQLMSQFPEPSMYLLARTTTDAASHLNAIRAAVASLNPDQALTEPTTMEQVWSEYTVRPRFYLSLLGGLALLGLALASVGIYGLLSQHVSQLTHEIGIRRALGARDVHVLRIVILQGMTLSLIGVAGGLIAAMVTTRLIREWLFEVEANDPATFAIAALSLLLVALIACYIPARRATRVDPLVALRYE